MESKQHTIRVGDIVTALEAIAPPDLAEEWDNTGLLVGDARATARRVMTCLTITPESADEAISEKADVIVTHHPLPFRPLKTITTGDVAGQLLLRLIEARCAVISFHTAFDSTRGGINEMLVERFGFRDSRPLLPSELHDGKLGAARVVDSDGPVPFSRLLKRGKAELSLTEIRFVAAPDHQSRKIAFACGSGGPFLDSVAAAGCDTLVTGEVTFHTCLAARATGVALMLLGHYASEQFAMEVLGNRLQRQFPGLVVWCSQAESDPIESA